MRSIPPDITPEDITISVSQNSTFSENELACNLFLVVPEVRPNVTSFLVEIYKGENNQTQIA
jgi:hypothetical protein